MNWLLDQLTKPRIVGSEVRQPNSAMLKAAELIVELSKLFEADKAGRIKAEAELAKCDEEISRLNADNNSLRFERIGSISAKAQYKEAMNEDYIRSFT